MNEERRLPPFQQVAVLTLVLIVIGGIYMAAHLPHHVPLAAPITLLVAAALLLAGNLFSLTRARGFAWHKFIRVGRWTLLAYGVIAGMLEYVFINNGTRGSQLVVLTGMLVVFAVNIGTLLAFSVARYESASEPATA